MKKIKSVIFYLIVFFIIWGIFRLFGPEYLQGQDRKKFIFKPIEYYYNTSNGAGIIIGLIIVGYGFYKYKFTIMDNPSSQDKTTEE